MLAGNLFELPVLAGSPAAAIRRHSSTGSPAAAIRRHSSTGSPAAAHGRHSSTGKASCSVKSSAAGFKVLPRRQRVDHVGDFPGMNDITSIADCRNSSLTMKRSCSHSSCTKERRTSLPSAGMKRSIPCPRESLQNCFMIMSLTKEAQRQWEEREARRIAAEKAQKATEAIKTHLLAAGDSADVADRILAAMSKDEKLLEAFDGSRVLPEVVQECRALVHRELFMEKLLRKVQYTQGDFRMTESQKQEITNRVRETLLDNSSHIDLLSCLHDQAHTMDLCVNAVMSAVHDKSATFHCPICMDPLVSITQDHRLDTSNMWVAPLRKTAHWSNHPCDHACCRSCMRRWTETSINDHKLRIKCPAEGCSYSLWDQDVQELVSPEVFERHRERKHADYLQHLKESTQDNNTLTAWLKSNARPCPECHVIVSRSEGCNHMICVCGASFCYGCGFKNGQCKCRAKESSDIWNPEGI